MIEFKDLQKISDELWEIPKSFRGDMRVPARVYLSEIMLKEIFDEKSLEQLVNVATLPGIFEYALAMPDMHQGYGFPIGGVAALDAESGVISPGGVGYDINCGVRLLTTPLSYDEVLPRLMQLANQIQRNVPSGVGRGSDLILTPKELDQVLNEGVSWALKRGYGTLEDQENTEEHGCFKVANAALVSPHAKERGLDQLGTLGAGNHFLEVQLVTEIFDEETANVFGLKQNQVTILIHTGSRGLGHQVCTDYVRNMNRVLSKYQISLPDRELAAAPFNSPEGQEYFQAMASAANFAWANRQIITDQIRKAWVRIFGGKKTDLPLVYDVAHNIAKLEKHRSKRLIVHRKGATRAFGPNHQDVPAKYQATGQPVLIPGSMGSFSYVLAGTKEAMQNSFGSTCHGAGRAMSRTKSKRVVNYQELRERLEKYGVVVRAHSPKDLCEEAPEAYKDINSVVNVVANSKISRKIAKLRPIAIIKG